MSFIKRYRILLSQALVGVILIGYGAWWVSQDKTREYTTVTYTYQVKGNVLKDRLAIWHMAQDASGAVLPRRPSYGPWNATYFGEHFAWGVAWDGGDTNCDFSHKSSIQCTVHVPRNATVRANVHFGNTDIPSSYGWACSTSTGDDVDIVGTFMVTMNNVTRPPSIDDDPVPGSTSGCHFVYNTI